ncbi:MAG: aminotransferase class V-fold PLP-dependent enzyme [Ruminococcaceae bacterium]|nr:aminotransferase class V-fold PLP-dependent enzyme [Oscillospiraceae bacterium]
MQTIYMDNAATSYPKPEGVSAAMKTYLDEVGATINRSVYKSAQDAGLVTLQLRQRLKKIFHFPGSVTHVILTPGMTWSVNMAIRGYLKRGDRCLVSSMEHNAVMRPLLSMEGVEVDRIPCNKEGLLDTEAIEGLIRPNTKMLVMAHGSNVCGSVQDAAAVGEICAKHGIAFVLDAAQTAGHYPVDFEAFKLSALCVPGHKGLLGPGGIGALLLRDDFAGELTPLVAGGTGSASDSEYLPGYLPDRFESGTPNLPGIYGWEAALRYVENRGVAALREHEMELCERFLAGLEGAEIIGTRDLSRRVGVIALDFPGQDNAEVAFRLESEFGILTRCGLHCAPSAHKTLDTFPRGVVRFSLGFASTKEEVDAVLAAVKTVSGA